MSSQPSGSASGITFRVLVAGEDGVGKTSLIIKFIKNFFEDSSISKSLGGDIITKKLDLFGAPIKLQIQDSASSDWEEVASYYVADNSGILVVLDVTSKAKMKPYLDYWIGSIRRVDQDIPIVVAGNKSDLQKKINIGKTAQYISKLGCNFIETSAKSGENVSYIFKLLVSEVAKHKAAAKKRSTGRRSDGLDTIFTRYDM